MERYEDIKPYRRYVGDASNIRRISDDLGGMQPSEGIGDGADMKNRNNMEEYEDMSRGNTPSCNPNGGRVCKGQPLAMVYSPLQSFENLYEPEEALEKGTLFADLYFPILTANGTRGDEDE